MTTREHLEMVYSCCVSPGKCWDCYCARRESL